MMVVVVVVVNILLMDLPPFAMHSAEKEH